MASDRCGCALARYERDGRPWSPDCPVHGHRPPPPTYRTGRFPQGLIDLAEYVLRYDAVFGLNVGLTADEHRRLAETLVAGWARGLGVLDDALLELQAGWPSITEQTRRDEPPDPVRILSS